MDATYTNSAGKSFLNLAGEMTIYDAENIRKSVMDAVFNEPARIEINLSAVEEVDTCGMQILMLAKRESQRLGKELVLTAHSAAVRELMDVFNLAEYFGDPVVLSGKSKK